MSRGPTGSALPPSFLLASLALAEAFTEEELKALEARALELAHEQESDASLRAALQLFAEAAANLATKVGEPAS